VHSVLNGLGVPVIGYGDWAEGVSAATSARMPVSLLAPETRTKTNRTEEKTL
jgi:hypothetical protein